MEWDKASVYRSEGSGQFWLSLFAWFALGMMGLAVLLRTALIHSWSTPVQAPPMTGAVISDDPAPLPSLLPFPLQLPSPEQIAAWREMAIQWGPVALVWTLLAVAALGTVWLVLSLLFRLLIWRPRSCGKFTLSHAQEMATQTLVAFIAVAVLAAGYFVPPEYLPPEYLIGLIPAGVFIGFCTAVPGEKGWFTWGRLIGEWRDALQWRVPDHYSIPYEPPPRVEPAHQMPGTGRGMKLSKLRRTLQKVNAQLDHPSTHPNQREAARVAQRALLNKIAEMDAKED